jgi:hypothetical protein
MKKPLSPSAMTRDSQRCIHVNRAKVGRAQQSERSTRMGTRFDLWGAEQGVNLLRPRELRVRSSIVRSEAYISRPTLVGQHQRLETARRNR